MAVREEYRKLIAPIEDFLYGQAGRQPGDPAKAAEAMIAVVDDQNAPRRLVLGADVYDVLDRTLAARAADIARYRDVGEATAFADAEIKPIGAPRAAVRGTAGAGRPSRPHADARRA